MPSQPQLATFKPLRGGWYRCNQTGDRTRRPKIYGRSYDGDALKKYNDAHRPVVLKQVTAPPIMLEVRYDRMFETALCPHCRRLNYDVYDRSVRMCDHCNKQFKTV